MMGTEKDTQIASELINNEEGFSQSKYYPAGSLISDYIIINSDSR